MISCQCRPLGGSTGVTMWPYWGELPLGLLFESPRKLFLSKPQKRQHFGLLFTLAFSSIFTFNKQCQNMVCCRYFKVSKVVRCPFLVSNRALIQLFWHFLAWQLFRLLFSKIWQCCFILLVTLVRLLKFEKRPKLPKS